MEVVSRVFVDYGTPDVVGRPYQDFNDGNSADAATWEDGPRKIDAEVVWKTLPGLSEPGCHRITWMVAHNFSGEGGCPLPLADLDPEGNPQVDYDEITWTVIVCAADQCPALDTELDCPKPTVSCRPTTGVEEIGGAQP